MVICLTVSALLLASLSLVAHTVIFVLLISHFNSCNSQRFMGKIHLGACHVFFDVPSQTLVQNHMKHFNLIFSSPGSFKVL